MEMRKLVASAAQEFWERNGDSWPDECLKRLLQGYEPAFGGCILIFLRSLKHLRFGDYGAPSSKDPESTDSFRCLCVPALLGSESECNHGRLGRSLSHYKIAGLQKLQSIRIDGRAPFELINAATLKGFEIGLYPIHTKILEVSDIWYSLSSITVLSVWLDVRLLYNNIFPRRSDCFSMRLATMMASLQHLKQLKIRLEVREPDRDFRLPDLGTYQSILGISPLGIAASLETLDIDTSYLQDILDSPESKEINEFLRRVEPVVDFLGLPNLGHIRAPQNALMSSRLDQDFDQGPVYLLQGSGGISFFAQAIEVIEVTDIMSDTIAAWGERLVQWKTAAQFSLVRLHKVILNWPETEAFDGFQASASSHSVWSQLRNVGVEVEHRLPGQPSLPA
jgi:hypothetical protein